MIGLSLSIVKSWLNIFLLNLFSALILFYLIFLLLKKEIESFFSYELLECFVLNFLIGGIFVILIHYFHLSKVFLTFLIAALIFIFFYKVLLKYKLNNSFASFFLMFMLSVVVSAVTSQTTGMLLFFIENYVYLFNLPIFIVIAIRPLLMIIINYFISDIRKKFNNLSLLFFGVFLISLSFYFLYFCIKFCNLNLIHYCIFSLIISFSDILVIPIIYAQTEKEKNQEFKFFLFAGIMVAWGIGALLSEYFVTLVFVDKTLSGYATLFNLTALFNLIFLIFIIFIMFIQQLFFKIIF